MSVALFRYAKSCIVQGIQSKRHDERVGRAITGGTQQDWFVSISVMLCGLLHTRQRFRTSESGNGRSVQECKACLGATGFEHIICVSLGLHSMLLFSRAKVNQSVWVESSPSESFLWGPVPLVTSDVQSLLSKRRAAFMSSLSAEAKLLHHGPVQFHSQLMLLNSWTWGMSFCTK